jgi:hypothetical protein
MKIVKLNRTVNLTTCLAFVVCLLSCDNPYNAEKAAKVYCKCMKQNNAIEEFNTASSICGDKLIASNRYVKLWSIDMSDRELDKKVSDDTRDSVKAFMNVFDEYTSRNCCKETLQCPDPEELK